MPDLNYNDMQRAVQDGMRNVQNDLQRISNSLVAVSQQAERIDDIEIAVRDLQRAAVTLQNTLVGMKSAAGHPSDPRLTQIVTELHELRTRFSIVEKFAAQMSEYVQARYEDDQEDRQYRAA
ncbi:hypothetical protein H7Y40_00835 [Pedobacter sp.]|nr:hypothetical protein [Candidatus Saccharibacteria bacterium]